MRLQQWTNRGLTVTNIFHLERKLFAMARRIYDLFLLACVVFTALQTFSVIVGYWALKAVTIRFAHPLEAHANYETEMPRATRT